MRITRETLINLGRREAERRGGQDDVLSGYLIGSVARGQPLLGGTTDIDLVLIHVNPPPHQREIVRLSAHIHLDILHHAQERYASPRELRVHPWLGPALCEPIFLYDPQHFFEWVQAGARGQFYRDDHSYARAQAFLRRGRQVASVLKLSSRWLKTYSRAVLEATNALACLGGFPAAGRRLVLTLENNLAEIGCPEMYDHFLHLMGGDTLSAWDMPLWLSAWARAYDAAIETSSEPEWCSCRRLYYLSGFQALTEAGRAEAILWTLVTTWEQAIYVLEQDQRAEPHRAAWESARKQLRLHTHDRTSRVEALARFLDDVEARVDTWATRVGA